MINGKTPSPWKPTLAVALVLAGKKLMHVTIVSMKMFRCIILLFTNMTKHVYGCRAL